MSTLFSFIQIQGDVRWGGRLIRPDYIMNLSVVFSTSPTLINSPLAADSFSLPAFLSHFVENDWDS